MKKCEYCQSEIDSKAKICPICKKRQNMKKVYIQIVSIIAIILVIAGVIVLLINSANKSKEKLEIQKRQSANQIFLSRIQTFNTDYLIYSINLENIANDIKTYWHDCIWEDKYDEDIDVAIDQAKKDNKENIDNANQNKEILLTLYNEINYSDCYLKYCDEIKENIKNAYDTYLDFHKLATSPSGSYNTYTAEFSKIDSNVSKAYNKLTNLSDLFSQSINTTK